MNFSCVDIMCSLDMNAQNAVRDCDRQSLINEEFKFNAL